LETSRAPQHINLYPPNLTTEEFASMAASSASLSTLPTELLLLLIPHLSRSSLAALLSTSHHFRYHLTKSLYTPLSSIFPLAASYACHTSNLPTLQILFAEYGVPINTPIIPSTGQTALHLSAEYGSSELVKWLLEHNANPNQESQHGQPLVKAKTREVVEMLVEKGAAVEARNARGERALDLATRTGRGEVVEALVRKGAGVNGGCRDPQVCDIFSFMGIAKAAARKREARQRRQSDLRSQAQRPKIKRETHH
jgi:hypothetical protein